LMTSVGEPTTSPIVKISDSGVAKLLDGRDGCSFSRWMQCMLAVWGCQQAQNG
jgi:hypothetical protein